jgi:hypothetical protein
MAYFPVAQIAKKFLVAAAVVGVIWYNATPGPNYIGAALHHGTQTLKVSLEQELASLEAKQARYKARRETIGAIEPDRPMPQDFFNYDKTRSDAGRYLYSLPVQCNLDATEITAQDHHCYSTSEFLRWKTENPEQAEAYWERFWRAEFAFLVLFRDDCHRDHFDFIPEMFARWNALSAEQRKEALDHERKVISEIPNIVDPKGFYEEIEGGWKFFCGAAALQLKEGLWNDHVIRPK